MAFYTLGSLFYSGKCLIHTNTACFLGLSAELNTHVNQSQGASTDPRLSPNTPEHLPTYPWAKKMTNTDKDKVHCGLCVCHFASAPLTGRLRIHTAAPCQETK